MQALNRRTLFGAAALAGTALAVPAMAQVALDDADLLALGRDHERLFAEYGAAKHQTSKAHTAYKRRLPAPTVITATDARVFQGLHNAAGKEASWAYEYLQKWLAAPHTRTSMPSAEARARELIKASEEQDKVEQRIAAETGLDRAGEREDDLYERLCDIEADIVAARCTTMAGLVIKARVARRLIPDGHSVENDWSDTVALSVIDVVLKMGAH